MLSAIKGAPAHIIGVCKLFQRRTSEAFPHVLRAYFEDCPGETEPETIRILPAANMLRDGFEFDQPLMEAILRAAETLRKRAQPDPNDEINEVIESRSIGGFQGAFALCTRPNLVLIQRLRRLDELVGDPSSRVFVGGAYSRSLCSIS